MKKWNKGKKRATIALIVLFAIMAFIDIAMWGYSQTSNESQVKKIEYSEFRSLLENGDIDTIYYSTSQEWMTLTLYNEESRGLTGEDRENFEYGVGDKRKVQYPGYDGFRRDMLEYDVRLVVVRGSDVLASVLNLILTLVVPIFLVVLMYRYMFTMGRQVDEKSMLQKSDIKFSDVIGQDEVIEDVKFVTQLLQDSGIGDEVGAKIPKGLLLAGDPGTGKTLIAKAIAGEANVPFIYVNSSSLIEMFVGVGAKRVRDIFKVARKHSPCIVFFDEIDSIGCKRDSRMSSSEHDQTINALLQEMDGFSGREGVFIIAATNRADKLDSALVRAGRFDRRVNVMPPRNWKVRKQLFDFYLSKFKVMDDVDIENLSKQVSGFTGADIAAICNEASIIAVMHGKGAIDIACIEEAIDKKVFNGNRSKRDQLAEDRHVVAVHEGGHALCHILLGETITRASIQSMNSGVGGVVFGEDTDSQFRTREYYENRIMICYAGRVAEDLRFKSVTQGASSDIAQATQLLYEYVANLGYDPKFGLLNLDVLYDRQLVTDSHLFSLMQDKSKELYAKTEKLLGENLDVLDRIANALLERETLTGSEVEQLIEEGVVNG